MEALQLREQDVADRNLILAWTIEALHRHKRLPELRTLLKKHGRRSESPQSVESLRATLEVLSAQYGIPLKRGKAN